MDNEFRKNNVRPLDEELKPNNKRMSANRLVGQGVHASKIGDVITGNPASTNIGSGISTGIVTVADATSANVTFTLSDNYGRVVMAVPDVAIYIDSISIGGQWPNATYGMGNMPVTVFNDWGQSNNVNTVTRVVVRNNTGGSRDIIVVCRHRLITNSSVALSGQTLGSV